MGNQKRGKIIFIVGPTASGKTAVGVFLAKMINGEIVSCDSMQVYQQIRIASNIPSEADRKAVAHHLVDCISLAQNFDVARFTREAGLCIHDIMNRGRVPVIVGGTGMYMKVLLDGIFEGPRDNQATRRQLMDECSRKGSEPLYRELKIVDPEVAKKIHPNDFRRIVRALEVYRLTGQPISQLQQKTAGLWGVYDISVFGLNLERRLLYDRINRRVDQMFDAGLIDEIRSVQGILLSKTAKAIIGMKEVEKYLSGEWDLGRAKEEMKKNTRRLAKRQLTWFRAEKRLTWVNVLGEDKADQTARWILKEWRRNE